MPTLEMAFEGVSPAVVALATCEDMPATRARALAREKDPQTKLWDVSAMIAEEGTGESDRVRRPIQSFVAEPITAPEQDTF